MLVWKVTSPPVVVFLHKNDSSDGQPLRIKLLKKGSDERYSHITINQDVVELDWDLGLNEAQNQRLAQVSQLRNKGKYEEALTRGYFLIQDSIVNGNGNKRLGVKLLVKTLLGLTRVYQNLQNWELAKEYSTFASELDPANVNAHISAAISFRDSNDTGDFYESFPCAEEAVHRYPDNISARNTLAITYRQVQLAEVALEHSEYALALERMKDPYEREASSYITLISILIDLANKHTQLEDMAKADMYYRWAGDILELGQRELCAYEQVNFRKLSEAYLSNLHTRVLERYFQRAA